VVKKWLARPCHGLCYAGRVTETPSPPDSRVGSVIQERYQILDLVASGGMGVVYRAERVQLGRTVAVKFLHPWVAAEKSFLQRFDVEAHAMSRLNHPNCVSVIDFGVADVPFLVMDFVAGRSLRFVIENEQLPPTRVIGLGRQILAGLAHAHAQGIVHRDLKPENIVVSDSPGLVDHLRILDFGLAKLHDGPALTVGMAIGTPSYMAPEQSLGEGAVDARTDIYAVGLLLFEMLTGTRPFVSDKVAELLLMHQQQPAPRMDEVATGVTFSDELEALVAKALAKTPADRFSNADDMAAALELVPENTGMHSSGANTVAVPMPSASSTSTAVDIDKTLSDKTLVDTRLPPGSVPILQPAVKAVAPTWKRSLGHFSKRWSPRQRWITATYAGAAVVIILASVLLLIRRAPEVVEVRQATSPATPSIPPAMDELAPMSPDGTPGLADAAQLVRLGLADQAITVLQDIRHSYPRSAYANFLLAVTYFDKMWWTMGLQQAQAAMQLDPAYRRSPKLAKVLIRSLMSDSFGEKAAAALGQDLAEVSPTYLEEASQFDKSARVRARAAQILASMRIPASGRGP